jgi:hypothetical protein
MLRCNQTKSSHCTIAGCVVLLQALWDSQHTWAGEQMYDLAISLRGFYLKVRGTFTVPAGGTKSTRLPAAASWQALWCSMASDGCKQLAAETLKLNSDDAKHTCAAVA